MPLAALLQSEVWSAAAQTSVGVATLLALLSICTAMLGWFLTDLVAKRVLAAIALLLFAASLAATGHASSAPPQWLARPAVGLHGLAAVFWIGAFLPLWLVLTPRNSTPLAVLNVFNYGIPVALLLLIISGVVLAFLQLVGWASL